MLETVKCYIDALPDTPFSTFYNMFVLHVADDNIIHEIRRVRNYGLCAFDYDKIVNTYLDRLVNSW